MCLGTLWIVQVVLSNLHAQRGKLASSENAADQLVDTLGQGFAEAQGDVNHLLAMQPASGRHTDLNESVEKAVAIFAEANEESDVAANTLEMRGLISPIVALRIACKEWQDEVVAIRVAVTERKKQADADLIRLRALVGSEEGRQRLQVAKKIRQFRATTAPAVTDLAKQIIASIAPGDQLIETTVEMNNLSLFTEKLMAEAEADRLADLKDNHFCSSLIRLREAIGHVRSTNSALADALDAAITQFEKSVFGDGYLIDNDQHFVRPGANGVYAFCLRRITLQQEKVELRASLAVQAENYNAAYSRFERQHIAWRDEMTAKVEKGLSRSWSMLLGMSLGGSGVLLAMGTRIAQSIRRQFVRIESMTTDLERANAQMTAIHETSLDGFITLDHSWKALDINRAAEQIFGLNREQATARPLGDLIAACSQSETDPMGILLASGSGEISQTQREFILGKRIEVLGKRSSGDTFAAEIAITAAAVKGAPLYVASLRDISDVKRAELEREELHDRLLTASRQAGMAEVATGVLHNVGNILNSVNVSAGVIGEKLRKSEVNNLKKAAEMLRDHLGDLPTYLTSDTRGRHLPAFLIEVAGCLEAEHGSIQPELEVVSRGLEHIKHIITAQQSHAKGGVVLQRVKPSELINTVLDIHRESFARHQVSVKCDFADIRELSIDKHKVLQILVNLITNAKNAVCEGRTTDRSIVISLSLNASADSRASNILFQVRDNGMGIAPENLAKIFAHGFTTRKEGHGFGLHSAANAAGEMGGMIHVASEGLGKGALFTLEIPHSVSENVEPKISRHINREAA